METFEEKQFRLREVRAFLLFQCKVLRNHRKRKVIEAEQEPQFLVGSGMSYELQKMEEFLTQSEAQTLYATMNYEYPVNPSVSPSEELNSWGEFKEDKLPVERLAELAPTAQKIIDRVGW